MPPIPSRAFPDADPSAASSTASGPTDGLLADAGPAFDAEAAAHAEPAPVDPDALAGGEVWTVTRVRALLSTKGELIHGVAAIDPDSTEWRYTQADLVAIAPALTRILNRHDVTRAAAAGGDELQLAIGFAGYGMRSWSERRRDLALQAEAEGYPDADQAGDEPPAAPEAAAFAGDEPEFPAPYTVPPIAPLRRN